MSWDPQAAFDDLPALPPAGEFETKAVLKNLVEARAALARLDARINALPNPTAMLKPMTLLEARAGAALKGTDTTTDELFTAETLGSGQSYSAREALRYRDAIWQAFQIPQSAPLSSKTLVDICSTVLGHDTRIMTPRGEYAGTGVIHGRRYTPPSDPARHIGALMDFVNEPEGVDPLIATGLAHYQLSAIRPFVYGNSRTGRVFTMLLLRHYGLLADPALAWSRQFHETRSIYSKLMRNVTSRGDWEPWLRYFVGRVLAAAQGSLALIDRLEQAQGELAATARQRISRLDDGLIDALTVHPYVRAVQIGDECGVSRQTASLWLQTLTGPDGPLAVRRAGRHVIYINATLLQALLA
ncbi:MAG: Fic family protein [Bifidobacteriaceae bacterium]|jgi:Fic family protein|nr:Fic family protein [Bifidobacteriaceae bacterium]